jgi:hypothetical protein
MYPLFLSNTLFWLGWFGLGDLHVSTDHLHRSVIHTFWHDVRCIFQSTYFSVLLTPLPLKLRSKINWTEINLAWKFSLITYTCSLFLILGYQPPRQFPLLIVPYYVPLLFLFCFLEFCIPFFLSLKPLTNVVFLICCLCKFSGYSLKLMNANSSYQHSFLCNGLQIDFFYVALYNFSLISTNLLRLSEISEF